jgi:hypothetical protein
VAYTHFGARLARPDRFDPCTSTKICAGSSTDQNSWPTPNRCGFNSRTAHHAGLARRSSPRSIIARRWFDSKILHQRVTGRDGRCTRLLIETRLVRFQRHPPHVAGLADKDMHSPFKRDEVGSIPTSRTRITLVKRRHSITEQCAELLPRTMRVQISLPLPIPTWGCGPTDEGTRLRTLRSEFNSLHPLHIS